MYWYFAVSQYTKAFHFMRLPVMLMQMSQMAVGLAIVGATYYYSKIDESGRGCTKAYTDEYFWYCGLMYFSYLCLFGKMFVDTFILAVRLDFPCFDAGFRVP